ncbi:MAG TPA: tRNA threonylcarbamoyladenosine dehydratase [Burkholderiaceae bacterium]|nr:tRNA threonylcarbamoyladenosine dehydratase [Burkholderiaceae bacterium]
MNAPEQPDDVDLDRRFSGVTRLYGDDAARRFRSAHVVVVGIGGVGSWAAEALARSAVGHLTLVDLDHIAESNTNRQIHALGDAYGKAKVDAMAERIRAINPVCTVCPVDEFAAVDNASFLIEGADIVLDCIDQVIAKAALIAAAKAAGVAIVTCGAAGGRFDPTRVRRDDLARLSGDPLLARVRHKLRRDHGFPRDERDGKAPRPFGVIGVYSDEPLQRPSPVCDAEGRRLAGAALACAGYGSSVVVTATMGFVAAGQALSALSGAARGPR